MSILCATSSVAQAQGTSPIPPPTLAANGWFLSYEFSGTSSGSAGWNYPYPPNNAVQSDAFVFDHKANRYSDEFTTTDGRFASGSADYQGANVGSSGTVGIAHFNPTVTVVWTWPGAPDQVPAYVTFLVKGNVSAQTNSDTSKSTRTDSVNELGPITWGAEDVWKGTVSGSITGLILEGAPVQVETPKENTNSWSHKGNKLFRIETKGRTRIDDVKITLDANAELKDGRYKTHETRSYGTLKYGMPGTANATGSVIATPEDRSVSISSSTIEPSYYKTMEPPPGTNPGSFGPFPARQELHTPDALGGKNTDSVARFHDGLWRAAPVHFSADNVGNWNRPSFDWSITGENVPSTGYVDPRQEHLSSLTYGFNFGPDGNSFPKSSTVKATVTDADGIVGENTFDIKWHLPYEKTMDLPDGNRRKDLYWVGQTHVPVEDGVAVGTSPPTRFDYKAAIDGGLVLAETAGVPGVSELGAVFKVVTSIPDWGETQESYNVEQYQLKNDPGKFKAILAANPDNVEGMTVARRDQLKNMSNDELREEMLKLACFVGRVRIHRQKNYLADQYDEHGYLSSGHAFYYDATVPNGYEFQLFYRRGNESSAPKEEDKEIPPSYNLG